MLPLSFLRAHGSLIAFGAFMCFASSFGQTFFISLFGGEIREAFGLTHGEFGTVYATGTMLSAATLVWAGRLIDKVPLARFAVSVLVGLAAMSLLMGVAWSVPALGVAIYGLRLFGQGLASHAGITAMARYFDVERGRAVGIASLGHPVGEFLLPFLVVAAFAVIDWRIVWTGTGLALAATAPMVFILLRGHGARDRALRAKREAEGAGEGDRTLGGVLRDPGFWLRLPALAAPSFIFTGLIFHQVHLADSKGWPLELMAASFTLFAVGSVVTMIATGPLVDRFSASRVTPLFLAPLVLACLVLFATNSPLAAPVFMALLGLNAGVTFVLKGALWAELYGTTHLGAIRSFDQAVMVFSTGLAPAAMGLLIDGGVSMEAIALASAVWCGGASALAAMAAPPARQMAPD
jgi:sugar phosphate permease